MIRLDLTTKKLQATMATTHSTSQPECIVSFFDLIATSDANQQTARGATQASSLSDITDIDICAAPDVQGKVRSIDYISIHNKDSAAQTVTVKMDISGVDYNLIKKALNAGETLIYAGDSWQVL